MWFLIVMILVHVLIIVIALAILLPAFIELRKDTKQLEEQIADLWSFMRKTNKRE